MAGKIPVSVIVATRNEERNLARCLSSLQNFDEIVVMDSHSTDRTPEIARSFGVRVVDFEWNRHYPKKRQWCLDHLDLKHHWVFFVDADEEVTPGLAREIASLDFKSAGYFIDGLYAVEGQILRHGIRNRKLCLIDRRHVHFPCVDDLDCPAMGEMEGHYQPVVKDQAERKRLQYLKGRLLHHACDDWQGWDERHRRYAAWENHMRKKRAHPRDPIFVRRLAKRFFQAMPWRGEIFFLYYFILRGGFLDGRNNFVLSVRKMNYYRGRYNEKRANR